MPQHTTHRTASRRKLLTTGAATGASAVAGCLDGGEESTPQPTDRAANEPTETTTTQEATATTMQRQSADIDLPSVQAAADGHVIPVAPGLGLRDAIAPGQTDTPVQDAIDIIRDANDNRGGAILLPPTTVEEGDSLTDLTRIRIQGFGVGRSGIKFVSGSHGLVLTGSDGYPELYSCTLEGAGTGSGTGDAIRFNGTARGFCMDQVNIRGWDGPVIHVPNQSAKPFEMNWGKVHVWGVSGPVVKATNLGPGNSWAMAKLNAKGGPIFHIRGSGGQWDIRSINTGGADWDASIPYNFRFTGNGGIKIGYINFEPGGDLEVDLRRIVHLQGHSHIDHVISHRTANYGVTLRGDASIGDVQFKKGEPRRAKVGILSDRIGNVVYGGFSTDVEVDVEGGLSTPVSCLGDLEVVQ